MTLRIGRRLLLGGTAQWLATGAAADAAAPPAAGLRLAAPFDPRAIRARAIQARTAAVCRTETAPMRDLRSAGFYTDFRSSQPDPQRVVADAAALAPLRLWLSVMQAPAETWLLGGDADTARCALRHLQGWARAEALLGQTNPQGAFHRKWTLAGAALAFLILRDVPELRREDLAEVADWLARVARAVMPPYERPARPGAVSASLNNHAYWAGLAVGAAGIAANDRELARWAVERAHIGLRQIRDDGALPQELARGRMALNYHLFALSPLTALERIATATGMPLGAADTASLDRCVALVAASLTDPSRMAAMTGEAQGQLNLEGPPTWRGATGLEVRQATRPRADVEQALAPLRPMRQAWLGGNVTLLWR